MPAHLLVYLRAQAHGTRYSEGGGSGCGVYVERDEIWPDQHQFAGAIAVAIQDGVFDDFAAVAAGVHERAQLLGHGDGFSGYGWRVQAWRTDDAGLYA